MNHDTILTLIPLVPVLGSLTLPLLGRFSTSARNVAALALTFVAFFGSLMLLPVVNTGEVVAGSLLGMDLFYADRLAVFMALVSSSIGAVILVYSFGYIKKYPHQNEYYLMAVLFLGAMMGLVYSRNLIGMYLFWEITAFACWRLIGFFREPEYVWRANKAFLLTVFGALMMLMGFILIYGQTGTFDLIQAKQFMGGGALSSLAVMLVMFGILSKSATVPLHSWLPDAGVAPSPVTALLHAAVLVKIGCYVYARLFLSTFVVPPEWTIYVPIIAGVSALVAGGAAVVENDIKKVIAYSTVSQLGYIIMGLSTGHPYGVVGALLFIMMHAISKGGLFLCAGIVEQRTHIKDMTRLGGLLSVMPMTAASFALCALSIMGIPPLGGFFGKFFVITGAVHAGSFWIAALFTAGSLLTIVYLFRVFRMVFLGTTNLSGPLEDYREGSQVMICCVVLLALLSVAGGIFFDYPSNFVVATVKQMLGTM